MTDLFDKQIFKMATLGRQFYLGDLYDCCSDQIIEGKCWESTDMKSVTLVNTDFKLRVFLPEPNLNRWEQMVLDQHTKVSTAAGIIDKYRGASTFISDQKNPAQVTRTVICRVRSKKEYLDFSKLINQDVQNLEREKEKETKPNEATHVIVGIDYGGEAYCVLTRSLVDETNQDVREDAEDELSCWADKMQKALDENQNVTEFKEQFDVEERKKLCRMKCRFYVDILAPTFRECNYFVAYKTCIQLIGKLKKINGKSKGIPVILKLCPLNVIKNSTESRAEYREIKHYLIERCCHILEELEGICAKGESARSSGMKLDSDSLRDFTTEIRKYLRIVKQNLKEAITRARAIDGNDHAVEKVIQKLEEISVFKPSQLEKWLRYKLAEVKFIKYITDCNGMIFLATESHLKKELKNSFGDTKYSLVLQIPSLNGKTNQILRVMNDYLETYTKLVAIDDNVSCDEDEENLPWYIIEWKKKKVLDKVKEFSDYIAKNKPMKNQVQYFITQDTNSQTFHYRYCIYEYDNFLKDTTKLPGLPTDLQVRVMPAKTFYLEWNYEFLGYPHQFLVEYQPKYSSDPWVQLRKTKSNQHNMTVQCSQDSVIKFRVAVDTCIGRSEFSDYIDTESAIEDNPKEESNELFQSRELFQVHQQPQILKSNEWTGSTKQLPVTNNTLNMSLKPNLKPPVNLKVELVTQTTAELGWSYPFHHSGKSKSIFTYRVRYYLSNQDPSAAQEIDTGFETDCRLEQLQSETCYVVYVIAVSNDGQVSAPSKLVNLTTQNQNFRIVETVLQHSKKNSNRNGMDLYTVPLIQTSGSPTAERFVFGKRNKINGHQTQKHRKILLMGTSGADKTVLINGMINYIFGVEWEDKFRFQLIEDQLNDRNTINKQTNKITAYDIYHMEGFRIPYSLTIVDTPEYGDIKGLEKDQEITEMIRQFFQDKDGIQELDAIGFVVPASLPRLTSKQLYTLNSMLSIFGKDVKESLIFLLTFADSQKPPILSAITKANFPCPTNSYDDPIHHKFNNSGLFCSSHESSSDPLSFVGSFEQFFWQMGMENFREFFLSLATMKTKSLSLTKQVLEERKKLEARVNKIYTILFTHTVEQRILEKSETAEKLETEKVSWNLPNIGEETINGSFNDIVETVAKCIQELEEIALLPNPFSIPEYIDLIIDSEQQENQGGYQERIENLKKLRTIVLIINKVRNKESLFSLYCRDEIKSLPLNQDHGASIKQEISQSANNIDNLHSSTQSSFEHLNKSHSNSNNERESVDSNDDSKIRIGDNHDECISEDVPIQFQFEHYFNIDSDSDSDNEIGSDNKNVTICNNGIDFYNDTDSDNDIIEIRGNEVDSDN